MIGDCDSQASRRRAAVRVSQAGTVARLAQGGEKILDQRARIGLGDSGVGRAQMPQPAKARQARAPKPPSAAPVRMASARAR